jgi:hypothetical protein
MTPEDAPAECERTMGCTEADLLRSLPLALPHATVAVDTSAGVVHAAYSDGTLRLTWRRLLDQRNALLTIPRLQVRFAYTAMEPTRRHEVQRRFDLATQRGGG